MKFIHLIFLISFILKSVNAVEVGDYSPQKPKNLDKVDNLVSNVQSVTPPLKTRGVGQNIFKNAAPATVIVASDEGMGSGFLLNAQGLIITNYHVIEKGDGSFSENVKLVFCPIDIDNLNSSRVFDASVIKVDKTRDLALFVLNAPVDNSISKIIPLETNPASVEIGMDVHAIGHPKGAYCSYTKGVVSRKINNHDWSYSDTSLHQADVIQTQTPINPGNSGGPLINDMGRVVGINTFINPEAVGINFAVSANEIIDFIENGPVAEIKAEVGCESRVISSDDLNENGVLDFFSYDQDCNGIEDMVEFDEDEDGRPDYIFLDANENGNPDVLITFGTHTEGKLKGEEFAIVQIDEDENGEYEKQCIDVDIDGEVDHCEPLV